jgi:G protein-coupled receptor 157
MLGALLIIISYISSKKLRSQIRFLLLNLSIMDFGVALANFIGLTVNFDGYYIKAAESTGIITPPSPAVEYSCIVEAAFACFCNISSVLWTISVAVYLYFRMVTHYKRSETFFKYLVGVLFLMNYGIPTLMTVWLGATKRLGFAPWDSAGWCSVITIVPPDRNSNQAKYIDRIAAIFGNDLWIMLTIFVIVPLYLSIKISAKEHLVTVMTENQSQLKNRLHTVDLKFTIIPLVFVILRLWSLTIDLLYDYIQIDDKYLSNAFKITLIILSGIGDSSQGLANGIIFVIFTRKARQVIFYKFLLRCCTNKTEASIFEESFKEPCSANEDSELLIKSKEDSAHLKYTAGNSSLYIIQSH